MMRFAPYFGIATALFFGMLIGVGIQYLPAPKQTPSISISEATSTLVTVPSISGTPLALEDLLPSLPAKVDTAPEPTPKKETPVVETATQATTTPKSQEVASSSAQPAATEPTAPAIPLSFDTAAATLRGALVNVICYAPAGSGIRSSSGSGVIIDPRGVILTNAHVAIPFLLTDHGVSCTIRTGSPAKDAYTASLMFISPLWVASNASKYAQVSPAGTGEHDYALLAITGSATNTPKPDFFSAIPLANTAPTGPERIVIASYAAQFLDASQIQGGLFPTVVFGSVKDVFTFATNTVDVLSLGGSAAAQEGSSGGGVVDASGKLIGTITTSTIQGDTATRNLNAITAAYIQRAYQAETGATFQSLVSLNPVTAAANFASQIQNLESIITGALGI